jgi:hypothetical protein
MNPEEFKVFIHDQLDAFLDSQEDTDEELTEDEWTERFKEYL